jgi:hypothetical protein
MALYSTPTPELPPPRAWMDMGIIHLVQSSLWHRWSFMFPECSVEVHTKEKQWARRTENQKRISMIIAKVILK